MGDWGIHYPCTSLYLLITSICISEIFERGEIKQTEMDESNLIYELISWEIEEYTISLYFFVPTRYKQNQTDRNGSQSDLPQSLYFQSLYFQNPWKSLEVYVNAGWTIIKYGQIWPRSLYTSTNHVSLRSSTLNARWTWPNLARFDPKVCRLHNPEKCHAKCSKFIDNLGLKYHINTQN